MNMSRSRIAVLSLGALLLLAPSYTHAHHPHFKKAFDAAINAKDFNALHKIFSDDAWDGKKGSVAGSGLHEWVKNADRVVLTKGPQENLEKLVMGLELFRPGQEQSDLIFVLTIPVKKSIDIHVGEKRFACKWKVTRLTKSFKEAEEFLERPLKYIPKPKVLKPLTELVKPGLHKSITEPPCSYVSHQHRKVHYRYHRNPN